MDAKLNPAHLGTNTSVAILVKSRGRNLLTLGTVDCLENYAPLGDINGRVLEEVIEEDLDKVFSSDMEE